MDVTVIIPAFNETDRIAETLEAVFSLQEVTSVVVVDDGSHDDTAKVAKMAGAIVIRHCRNYGKGRALRTGLDATQAPVVVFVDADLGKTAVDIRHLILPILEGQADMTIAQFPRKRKGGGLGLVKNLARMGIRSLTGLTMESPLSGQRAVRRIMVDSFSLGHGYGVEVGMTIDAALCGWRVIEVPVMMSHREYGKTLKGFLHRARQMVHIAKVLVERGSLR